MQLLSKRFFCLVLLISLSLFEILVQGSEELDKSSWARIEQYITRKTTSKDGYENYKKALGWYYKSRFGFARVPQDVYEALKKLIIFHDASQLGDCSKEDYELRRFFENLKNDPGFGFDRLNKIIGYDLRIHSKNCQYEHNRHYKRLALNKDYVDRLETVLYNIIYLASSEEKSDDYKFDKYLKEDLVLIFENKEIREKMIKKFIENQWNEIASKKNSEFVYEAISVLAHENKEREFVKDNTIRVNDDHLKISPDGAEELLRIFLFEPCDYFEQVTESEVFGLAQQDLKILGRVTDSWDKYLANYFFGWAQYEICKTLLNDEKLRKKLLMKIQFIARDSLKAMENDMKNLVVLNSDDNESIEKLFS